MLLKQVGSSKAFMFLSLNLPTGSLQRGGDGKVSILSYNSYLKEGCKFHAVLFEMIVISRFSLKNRLNRNIFYLTRSEYQFVS
jgi:hypothetical protein